MPYATIEARWFVPGPLPPDAAAWFTGLGRPVAPEARTDHYLPARDAAEAGVKLRDGRLEVKQRTAALGVERLAAAAGCVEAWRKWGLPLAADDAPEGWVAVGKVRRVRTFAFAGGRVAPAEGRPAAGADLELAALEVAGAAWWSVCVEAFGPDEAARLAALRAVAAHAFGPGTPPALTAARSMGYPAWLAAQEGR